MNTEDSAYLAAEARFGGRCYTIRFNAAGDAYGWTAVEYADLDLAVVRDARFRIYPEGRRKGQTRLTLPALLPEAAFDWPIYRAAVLPAPADYHGGWRQWHQRFSFDG